MRKLFKSGILFPALLLSCILQAEGQEGSYQLETLPVEVNRELPRSRTVSYNSEAAARERSLTPSLYLQPLDGEWRKSTTPDGKGTVFTHVFKVPFSWVDRRYFLYIEYAGGAYEINVNGKFAGYNQSGSSPAEFELTPYSDEGINQLAITVWGDSPVSVLQGGGRPAQLSGNIYIVSQPRVRIRDYSVNTSFNGIDATVELGVIVKSHMLNPKTVRIHYELSAPGGESVSHGYRDASFEMKGEDTVRFLLNIPRVKAWTHESPELYTLLLRTQHEGRYTEYITYKLGLRTAEASQGKLSINGYFPELSVAEAEWAGSSEATGEMLRGLKNRGINTVKVKARPQPDLFYELCDEIGLYVCNQADINTGKSGNSRAKGGNPSNDPVWEKSYADRALSMYYTSQGHPSVVMFSLAENSSNGYNLYESYLAMKRVETSRPVIYVEAGGEWNTDAVFSAIRNSEPAAVAARMRFDIAAAPVVTGPEPYSVSLQPNADKEEGAYTIVNNSSVSTFHGTVKYSVKQGMKKVSEGAIPVSVLPGERYEVRIPAGNAKAGKKLKYQVSLE